MVLDTVVLAVDVGRNRKLNVCFAVLLILLLARNEDGLSISRIENCLFFLLGSGEYPRTVCVYIDVNDLNHLSRCRKVEYVVGIVGFE